MFPITSICIDDIIQGIEDDNKLDELEKAIYIRKARKLDKNQMNWIAGKLADDYCGGDFWRDLDERFKQIIEEKNDKKKQI